MRACTHPASERSFRVTRSPWTGGAGGNPAELSHREFHSVQHQEEADPGFRPPGWRGGPGREARIGVQERGKGGGDTVDPVHPGNRVDVPGPGSTPWRVPWPLRASPTTGTLPLSKPGYGSGPGAGDRRPPPGRVKPRAGSALPPSSQPSEPPRWFPVAWVNRPPETLVGQDLHVELGDPRGKTSPHREGQGGSRQGRWSKETVNSATTLGGGRGRGPWS